jgi:hypothetical protein
MRTTQALQRSGLVSSSMATVPDTAEDLAFLQTLLLIVYNWRCSVSTYESVTEQRATQLPSGRAMDGTR